MFSGWPLQNHKSFDEIPAVQSLASSDTIHLCIYYLPLADFSEIVAIILSYVKLSPQRRFKIAAKVFQAFQMFLFCMICCELDAGSAINAFFKDQSFFVVCCLDRQTTRSFLGLLYSRTFRSTPVFNQKRPRSTVARSRSAVARTSANLMRNIFE